MLTFDVVFTGAVNWVFINWLPLFFQETFARSLGGVRVGPGGAAATARPDAVSMALLLLAAFALVLAADVELAGRCPA